MKIVFLAVGALAVTAVIVGLQLRRPAVSTGLGPNAVNGVDGLIEAYQPSLVELLYSAH